MTPAETRIMQGRCRRTGLASERGLVETRPRVSLVHLSSEKRWLTMLASTKLHPHLLRKG